MGRPVRVPRGAVPAVEQTLRRGRRGQGLSVCPGGGSRPTRPKGPLAEQAGLANHSSVLSTDQPNHGDRENSVLGLKNGRGLAPSL